MNLKERLRHLAEHSGMDRHYGRSKEICNAAKRIGGVVLAASFDHSKYLQRMNPEIIVKPIDVNIDDIHGPFLFDHFAVETLLKRAANKIETIEIENRQLRKVIVDELGGITAAEILTGIGFSEDKS